MTMASPTMGYVTSLDLEQGTGAGGFLRSCILPGLPRIRPQGLTRAFTSIPIPWNPGRAKAYGEGACDGSRFETGRCAIGYGPPGCWKGVFLNGVSRSGDNPLTNATEVVWRPTMKSGEYAEPYQFKPFDSVEVVDRATGQMVACNPETCPKIMTITILLRTKLSDNGSTIHISSLASNCVRLNLSHGPVTSGSQRDLVTTQILSQKATVHTLPTTMDNTEGTFVVPLLSHDTVRRRRRSLSSHVEVERPSFSRHDPRFLKLPPAAQIAGLYQGYGTNYADLWCGSPGAQRQTVIVDTGSGVTAFPCQGCRKCGVPDYHLDSLYDKVTSRTFRTLECDECLNGNCNFFWDDSCSMGRRYAEGSSWRATEVADRCYVGGYHASPIETPVVDSDDSLNPAAAKAFELKFGCQTSITGLFVQQLADGIMGMDYDKTSFWWQMHKANKISNRAFSLCMGRSGVAERPVGVMSLGGTNQVLHDGTPMIFAKMSTSSMGYYNIRVRGVFLQMANDDTPVRVEDFEQMRGVIVDSGTTDTYFSRSMAEAFHATYQKLTNRPYDNSPKSYDSLAELQANEPTILLQIAGDTNSNTALSKETPRLVSSLDRMYPLDVLLAIPPEHYFEYNGKHYQSRFYMDERSSHSILGANSLMGHDVLFDLERLRLGIAESSCNYTAVTSQYPVPPPTLPDREERSYDASSSSSAMCSSRSCQYSMLMFPSFFVVYFARRILRGRPRNYEAVRGNEEGAELAIEEDAVLEDGESYRDEHSVIT